MSSTELLIEEEWVCAHGHSLTPAGQLKIRKLYEQAAQAAILSKAEQLLLDILVHKLSGEPLRNRIRNLSPKMAALLDAMNSSVAADDQVTLGMSEIKALVLKNQMHTAIKRYRELHGCSLLEAKCACEALR